MKRPDLEQALGIHLETTCLDVSSASTGYKRETAGFSASVAVKVGWGLGWLQSSHYMDLLDPPNYLSFTH